jgi:hypothetical protein
MDFSGKAESRHPPLVGRGRLMLDQFDAVAIRIFDERG